MHKERKDNQFIKKPIYPGGLKAMRALIQKELTYPEEAIAHKIQGTVYLRYEINHQGNVIGTKILSSLGYGCDEEASRIVKKFKFEVPKNPRKLKVKFHKTIKIHFKLPTTPSEDQVTGTQLSYSIVKSPSSKTESETKKHPAKYTYTIQVNS